MNDLKSLAEDYKVIVVDDNKSSCGNINAFLNKYFQDTMIANNWPEAFKKMKQSSPDIIITDISMPGVNGLELVRNVKKIDNDMEIIIVTAHYDTKDLLESLHIGVTDFITKPIDYQLLKEAIEKALKNLKNNKNLDNKTNTIDESNVYSLLKEIKKRKAGIEFINYYQGVPIIRLGSILNVEDKVVEAELDPVQLKAIIYEKFTSIEVPQFSKSFVGEFKNCDKVKSTVKLTNFKLLQYSPKRRILVRVTTDDNFKLIILKNNMKHYVKVNDISAKSISFDVVKDKELFKINEEFTLHIAIYQTSQVVQTLNDTVLIKCNAKVYQNYSQVGKMSVVATFSLDTEMQKSLNLYISSRELELVNEFKRLTIKSK